MDRDEYSDTQRRYQIEWHQAFMIASNRIRQDLLILRKIHVNFSSAVHNGLNSVRIIDNPVSLLNTV
jgi:hypothetical protein